MALHEVKTPEVHCAVSQVRNSSIANWMKFQTSCNLQRRGQRDISLKIPSSSLNTMKDTFNLVDC